MSETLYYMVYSNPTDGRDDEFIEWYETVHIPEVLAVPGMLSAQRCRLKVTKAGREGGLSPETHRYCVVYEMDGEPDEVMEVIRDQVATGEMHMSDVLDMTSIQMLWWTKEGEKQVAPGR